MKEKMMKEFKTFSQEETIEIGKALGRLLNTGDIVCINEGFGDREDCLYKRHCKIPWN